MRDFLDEQGRTRVFVPRIAGQEGVLYVRRRLKPAENTAHRKKSHFWMKTLCHPFDLL